MTSRETDVPSGEGAPVILVLTGQEALDVALACAFLSNRGPEIDRPRFGALVVKVALATADSDVDIDALRQRVLPGSRP